MGYLAAGFTDGCWHFDDNVNCQDNHDDNDADRKYNSSGRDFGWLSDNLFLGDGLLDELPHQVGIEEWRQKDDRSPHPLQ